eukprot:3279870-Prymnesium_polylepis.1
MDVAVGLRECERLARKDEAALDGRLHGRDDDLQVPRERDRDHLAASAHGRRQPVVQLGRQQVDEHRDAKAEGERVEHTSDRDAERDGARKLRVRRGRLTGLRSGAVRRSLGARGCDAARRSVSSRRAQPSRARERRGGAPASG